MVTPVRGNSGKCQGVDIIELQLQEGHLHWPQVQASRQVGWGGEAFTRSAQCGPKHIVQGQHYSEGAALDSAAA